MTGFASAESKKHRQLSTHYQYVDAIPNGHELTRTFLSARSLRYRVIIWARTTSEISGLTSLKRESLSRVLVHIAPS